MCYLNISFVIELCIKSVFVSRAREEFTVRRDEHDENVNREKRHRTIKKRENERSRTRVPPRGQRPFERDRAPHDEIIFSFRRSVHVLRFVESKRQTDTTHLGKVGSRRVAFSQIARDENARMRMDRQDR